MTWVIAFLVAENENRQLEDLPLADFGRVHKNISFVKRKKSITENFVKRKLRPLSVSVMVQRIFSILSLIAVRFTTFFSRIVKPIISCFKKSNFLPSKGLLCLHDKQNDRWSLADMKQWCHYRHCLQVYTHLFLYKVCW